jgi:hypothetical protein
MRWLFVGDLSGWRESPSAITLITNYFGPDGSKIGTIHGLARCISTTSRESETMIKSPLLAMIALTAGLSVGSLMNIETATAQTTVCPPNTLCPPTGGTQPPKGTAQTTTPPAAVDQNGQNQTGNMDWKKRHRHNNVGGDQAGQYQSGNMDMRHRHDRRFSRHNFSHSGSDVSIGIYLGSHHYDAFVSCREAGNIVRASGFRHVRTESCGSRSYHFLASKRGRPFHVAVSRRGQIVAVNPAY